MTHDPMCPTYDCLCDEDEDCMECVCRCDLIAQFREEELRRFREGELRRCIEQVENAYHALPGMKPFQD